MLKNNKLKLSLLMIFTIIIGSLAFTVPSTAATVRRAGEKAKLKTINSSPATKIDSELRKAMEKMADDELLPIWIWRKDVDDEIISNEMIEEHGLDPAIYEDEERFSEEIIPDITERIEELVGTKEAHKTVAPEQMDEKAKRNFSKIYDKAEIPELFPEDEEVTLDRSISLVDKAINAEIDQYIVAKREVLCQEYSELNNEFIDENIGEKEREILYNSQFTSTLVVEATKAEIEAYAKDEMVESIALFVEMQCEPAMDIVTQQINADATTGTKSSQFNSGVGYKGTGVRVGVIEMGLYNPNSPQLSGIHNKRLFQPTLPGLPMSSAISDHATLVTSLIVGQSATSGGRVYEGVVPMATVYQVAISHPVEGPKALQELIKAPYSVNVISQSVVYKFVNTALDMIYSEYEKEFDKIVSTTGVTVVNAAGNEAGIRDDAVVPSPGKALNIITVGNAVTKTQNGTGALSNPYSMSLSSSFGEANYLPNKPDITAPGTYVNSVGAYPGAVSGTSFSAPLVTGVVGQMMQANSSLKANPRAVKSKLLLAADKNKISSTNNPIAPDSQFLREKSGAGFLDAAKAVDTARNSIGVDIVINSMEAKRTQNYYFRAGQKIRAVMVYEKNKENTVEIQSANDMPIIDFLMNRQNGNAVVTAVSDRNNVRIIEHTFATSGYYNFSASPYQLASNLGDGINVHISFQTDSPYSVIYNVNESDKPFGGTVPTDSALYSMGDTVNIKSGLLTKAGYRFVGWTMNADGTGTVYQHSNSGSNRSFKMPASNVTLYAKFLRECPVTYDANGGEGFVPTDSNAYIAGEMVYITQGIPTREGYKFVGWMLDDSDDGEVYHEFPSSIRKAVFFMPSDDVTFYAKWAEVIVAEVEGVDMEFKVLSFNPGDQTGTVQLGDGYSTAINTSTAWSIYIPEEIVYEGVTYTVVSIGEYAFKDCINLSGVYIPDTIMDIQDYAFAHTTPPINSAWRILYIGNGVTSIGEFAFYQTGAKYIKIGSAVTDIGSNAFFGCPEIQLLEIYAEMPPKVGYNAFTPQQHFTVRVLERAMHNYRNTGFDYIANGNLGTVWEDF